MVDFVKLLSVLLLSNGAAVALNAQSTSLFSNLPAATVPRFLGVNAIGSRAADFLPSTNASLTSLTLAICTNQFELYRPTSNLVISLRAPGSVPTGAVLATWSIGAETVPACAAPFSSQITVYTSAAPLLRAGSAYWIRLDSSTPADRGYVWLTNSRGDLGTAGAGIGNGYVWVNEPTAGPSPAFAVAGVEQGPWGVLKRMNKLVAQDMERIGRVRLALLPLAEQVCAHALARRFPVAGAFVDVLCERAVHLQELYEENQIGVFQRIYNDPPDPNYTTVASPTAVAPPSLQPQGGVPASLVDAVNRLTRSQASVVAVAEALLKSLERQAGGELAGSAVWEARQREAVALYTAQLGDALSDQLAARAAFQASWYAAGLESLPFSIADVSSMKARVATTGLSAAVNWWITALGLGSAFRAALLADILSSPLSEPVTFPESLNAAGDVLTLTTAVQSLQTASGEETRIVDLQLYAPGNQVSPIRTFAILSRPDLAAADIDATSLTFGRTGDETSLSTCSTTLTDLNRDNRVDLICSFDTTRMDVPAVESFVTLRGTTRAGTRFFGTTTIVLPTAPLRFVPLAPCRVMETRAEYNHEGRTGPFGPPFLAANETRTLQLPASTVCQIPSSAKAYAMNVTLIPRVITDFLTVWPAGDSRPEFWTVRSPDGQVAANSAIVRAGVGGGVSVLASGAADVLIDISGYFTDASSGLLYYPITPCRVIDTRSAYRTPSGPFGPPTMLPGETRRFRVPHTPYCSIPAGASAYSATMTAVPPAPLAFVTMWPAGGVRPGVSSLNSFGGRVVSNSVIAPASADGSVDIFTFNRTDVIVDINGYFAPDTAGQGLFFFTAPQCRISDSRLAGGYLGVFGGPAWANEETRTVPVSYSPNCPVLSTAKALAVNVTVIPEGNPMPYLSLWPTGLSRPNASIINAFDGQTVTAAALIPTGSSGSLDVFTYRRTHVVLELSGYFGR